MKQVHYEKGSLLDLNEVYLSEGPWPHRAYHDAAERAVRSRPVPWLTRLTHPLPPLISGGVYPLQLDEPETEIEPDVLANQ